MTQQATIHRLPTAVALREEAVAAHELLRVFQDTLADDDDAKADLVEGETDFMEVLDRCIDRDADLSGKILAIGTHIEELRARQARLEQRRQRLRAAMLGALQLTGLRKVERPLATVSERKPVQRVEVFDEGAVPDSCKVTIPPRVSLAAVGELLKRGEAVNGARLVLGPPSIAIKRS